MVLDAISFEASFTSELEFSPPMDDQRGLPSPEMGKDVQYPYGFRIKPNSGEVLIHSIMLISTGACAVLVQ